MLFLNALRRSIGSPRLNSDEASFQPALVPFANSNFAMLHMPGNLPDQLYLDRRNSLAQAALPSAARSRDRPDQSTQIGKAGTFAIALCVTNDSGIARAKVEAHLPTSTLHSLQSALQKAS
jgi:hypothetical protein